MTAATVTMAGERQRLDIGKVFSETFRLFGRNLRPLLMGSAVLVAAPQLAVGFVQWNGAREMREGIFTTGPTALVGALAAILFGILNLWFQGGVNRFINDDLLGRKANLVGDILETGGVLHIMIGAAILMVMGCGLASILLLVPGVILGLAWSVAVPVVAIEQAGVIKALNRSLYLTRGHRWSIFLLGLIFYATILLISGLVVAVTGGMAGGTTNPWRLMVFQPLLGLIGSPLSAVGFAVLYRQLLTVREGLGTTGTADVFA